MVVLRSLINKRTVGGSLLALVLATGTGCEVSSFIDPSELEPGQNYRQKPLAKNILNNLDSGYEEPSEEFIGASDPKPEDLDVNASDYVIGKSDLVSVSIMDLVAPGVETVKTSRVSESGNITLPNIGQIKTEGLTEAELQTQVAEAYRKANIINNATVTATVVEARARTFSVLGSVGAPGQYAIVQSDFRLLDALVLCRDVTAGGVDYLYVIRQDVDANGAGKGATTKPATQPADDLAPRSRNNSVMPIWASAQPAAEPPMAPPGNPVDPMAQPPVGAKADPAAGTDNQPFEFKSPAGASTTRVIRIPVSALKNGELKYNIVVRPRDMIIAPTPTAGEYYMGGHVARVGVYSLTGRQITLKMAVVAAGMLDGLAVPARTEIVRRISKNQEVYVRVDLGKVFSGDEPDIFLKPNDVVQVGTNFFAPFIAAIRGGFRFTYGFGFLYDRNFANENDDNN